MAEKKENKVLNEVEEKLKDRKIDDELLEDVAGGSDPLRSIILDTGDPVAKPYGGGLSGIKKRK